MRRNCVTLMVASLLGGCVGSAPPLPSDTTSVSALRHSNIADFSPADQAMTCPQIADEQTAIISKMRADNLVIDGNRGRNEAALYVAGLSLVALPVALATVQNDAERKDVME
jgi:hypothetical protein